MLRCERACICMCERRGVVSAFASLLHSHSSFSPLTVSSDSNSPAVFILPLYPAKPRSRREKGSRYGQCTFPLLFCSPGSPLILPLPTARTLHLSSVGLACLFLFFSIRLLKSHSNMSAFHAHTRIHGHLPVMSSTCPNLIKAMTHDLLLLRPAAESSR